MFTSTPSTSDPNSTAAPLNALSDEELVTGFRELIIDRAKQLYLELKYLQELDRRKLFFHHSSLRAFLVAEFQMEEWEAERKIRASRFLRRFAWHEKKIASGALNLSLLEIVQACAHREKLSDEEISEALALVSGKSCRAARRELAVLYPAALEERPSEQIRPLTDEISELKLVIPQELIDRLSEIRGLLAHAYPGLNLGGVIDVISREYYQRHHPQEKARRAEKRARRKRETGGKQDANEAPGSRRAPAESEESARSSKSASVAGIASESQSASESAPTSTPRIPAIPSAAVKTPAAPRVPAAAQKHALTLERGYQCEHLDPHTQARCSSRFALEIDHIQSWAEGGKTELTNLRYLCRAHHQRASFLRFGEAAKYAQRRKRPRDP